MILRFDGNEDDVHDFLVFDFDDGQAVPPIPGPYLLLARNVAPDSPSTHTAIYAGETRDCRRRRDRHAEALERFAPTAAATVDKRFDRGAPCLMLIPENWESLVPAVADPREHRVAYETKLKFLCSPICDFEARHLKTHRGARRFRPGNHLVNVNARAGRLDYGGADVTPPPSPPGWLRPRPSDRAPA
jgi:hypothetical protein